MRRDKRSPAKWRVWPRERKTRKKEIPPGAVMELRPELVHCEECRFLEIAGCYGECGRGYLGIVRPEDYCSRAERRNGRGNEKQNGKVQD